MEYDAKQLEAISRCCDINNANRVVPVTGQAGTGKTTLIRDVYHKLREAGYRVALCAPTGKAAKRIEEATGIRAKTIHRLLEYTYPGERDPETGQVHGISEPRRFRSNPLELDVVLADEYAMVNNEVHRNLFDALPLGGSIRVFGDVNQLRPIETSDALKEQDSPFQKLLKQFNGIYLETIHRQSEGSGIVENGQRILRGRMPKRCDDFTMKITDDPITALRGYIDEQASKGVEFNTIDNQVIVVGRRSWVGTPKVNNLLQTVFRPESDGWLDVPRHPWAKTKVRFRVGDKVINTKNIYAQPEGSPLEVFNGESGIIIDISEFGEIVIDLGDRVVTFPPVITYEDNHGRIKSYDPRKELDLAYAITCHKSQGSEYQHVVYILNRSQGKYLRNRANFYTGITRARTHVHVISDLRSLQYAVSNNRNW